ncbi:hypothetical protein HDV00_009514 [Rhizophlyctis rosea]|nr:hypothetical protein HDV00_009514 [Rhizophlyctis rosea]
MIAYATCGKLRAISLTPGDGEVSILLDYISKATRGDPLSVLAAIDTFAKEQQHLMTIGSSKGETLRKAVRQHGNPKVIVELGGFVGYSAILLAEEARKISPHFKVWSFEVNPEYAQIAQKAIDHAGLTPYITMHIDPSSTSITSARSALNINHIDIAFIDHWKGLYVTDIKLLESEKLLKKGSIVLADNIYRPEHLTEYLAHVQNNDRYATHLEEWEFTRKGDGEPVKDAVAVSVVLRD